MAAELPLTRHLPQPGETEINTYMPSRHQQTLLHPATTRAAAAAVCLTATSSLIQGWGTRVPLLLLLHLLLPATPQYLSKVGPMRPGDTRAGPAVTPWIRASTGLQDCYLSASRATIRSWIVRFQFPPSITLTSALLCPQPTPPVPLSSPPIFPCPSPPAPSAAIATAADLVV